MGKLTNQSIKSHLAEGIAKAVSDGEGLTLTISQKGTATWIVRYRYAGRPRELTLGRYPELSLADARIGAADARKALSSGKDPGVLKQQEKVRRTDAMTLEELFDDFIAIRGKDLSPVSVKNHKQSFEKNVKPKLGSRLATDLSSQDVIGLARGIKQRSHTVAKQVWENLSSIFGHGVSISAMPSNPCRELSVRSVLGKAPRKRPRIQLTLPELMILCARLNSLGEINRLAILILLATCVRKSELIEAQWKEIDFKRGFWFVPGDRTGNKNRTEYIIPLAPLVLGWFERLKELAGDSKQVLPPQARNSRNTHMSRSTLNNVLNKLDDAMRHCSPHDLRSTARSYLRDIGVRTDVIERCLNHSLGGVEEVYQAGNLFAERKQALSYWAQLINDAALGRALDSEVLPPLIRESLKEQLANPDAAMQRLMLHAPNAAQPGAQPPTQ